MRDVAGGTSAVVSQRAATRELVGPAAHLGDGAHVAYTTDAGVAAGGGPGGLRVMVADLAAHTITTASPPAPLGSFDSRRRAL